MKLDQSYNPLEIEEKWYDFWMKEGFFHADEHSEKEPYTIVIPPPNVTGVLHMGHAIFVTLQDLLIRWKRMQGYETLWLPGTDHAGIATQVVVERLLKQEGTNRHELGREKFLERIWQWKEESGGKIINQLKRMGASCDWERERFTMDEGLSHAVRTIFVKMYREGLIYRGDRMVNWDPATQTVLSNLEVLTSKEGEKGKFWYLRYPLADGSGHIIVGTTRPETMLGDTAVAVHPEDPRYKDLIGKEIALPLTNRKIPIIADEILPDPEKGTGAVKVTPSHDPNDYECGLRHNLPQIQVIGLDGCMMAETCSADFAGLDRYDARKKVIAQFEELGLLDRIEDNVYSPGRSERSGVIVEPLVMKQWFVSTKPLAKMAIDAVESGETKIIPEVWKKTYDHFMYNIHEWCISRQLWWGHQIPAWYGPDGHVFVAMDAQEAAEQAKAHYGNDVELTQEEDVLDTWFSSGLWPFSTMGWPENTDTLKKFYPTQVLETGSDILFFWVARMLMMGTYVMGKAPFSHVFLHAMVRDEKGQKMSKVKGNVIDPLHMINGVLREELHPTMHKELIKKLKKEKTDRLDPQGADALRFTLAILAAQARDIKLDLSRMEGYRGFLNKLWNASKFALMNLEDYTPKAYSTYSNDWKDGAPFAMEHLNLSDKWILTQLEKTVVTVTQSLEDFRFNDAAQAMYDFVWRYLCDWHVELSKPVFYDNSSENADKRKATQGCLLYVLDQVLRLLHPIVPFITEDIWQSLPKTGDTPKGLIVASWPISRPELNFPQAVAGIERGIALISSIRTVRGETGVKPGVVIPHAFFIVQNDAQEAEIKAVEAYVCRMTKIEELRIVRAEDSGAPMATAVSEGVEIRIPLKGLIDVAEERARLDKAMAKVQKDLEFIVKKLSNEKFVSRAPEAVVQKERDKKVHYEQEIEALQKSYEELAALE